MMNIKIMTEEEKNIVVRVEDDIRVMQCVLWDNDLLYDEEDFDIDRVREALLYGAYHDDIGYIMQGLDILKTVFQDIEGLETEDYNFFNGCVSALEKVVDRHIKR